MKKIFKKFKKFVLRKIFGVNQTNERQVCYLLWESRIEQFPMVCDACPEPIYKTCHLIREALRNTDYYIVKI